MELVETTQIAAAVDAVNLADWIFGLTDEEYQTVARGHHAMGVIGGAQRLGLINVEEIGGTLIVQHYRTEAADAGHVRFLSRASEGFLMRTVPFRMKVWWDMSLMALSARSSRLTCRIGFEAPGWVTMAGKLVGNIRQLRKHLVEETAGFGRDIESKLGS